MNPETPLQRYEGAVPSPFAIYRLPFLVGALGTMLPSVFGIASYAVRDLNALRSIEELEAHETDVKSRIHELDEEFAGLPFNDEARAEFAELQEVEAEIGSRVKELKARNDYIKRVVDEGDDRRSEPVGFDYSARNVQVSSRQIPDNIYAIDEYRKFARNDGDDLRARLHEGAKRAIELGTPADDRADKATVAKRLSVLLAQDDDRATLGRRILTTGSPTYLRAFGKAMRQLGTAGLTATETSALQMGAALELGTDTAGGFAVPFTLDPTVILTSDGVINPLRTIARVETVLGKKWQGVKSTGIVVTRHPEADESDDDSPVLAQPEVETSRVQGWVPFSVELDVSWQGLQSEVSRMLADAKDAEEAESFINGIGTGDDPAGLIGTMPGSSLVPTAGAGTFDPVDLYALKNATPPRFRSRGRFLGEGSQYDLVRQFDEGGGANLWVQLADPTPPRLIGYPAHEMSTMDADLTPGSKILVFGDFKQFLIADRIGMSVQFVPVVFGPNGRPTGERGIFAIWANGSGILTSNAFRVLEVASS